MSESQETAGLQAQIFKAIAVQRPIVVEYLKALRRDKPNATVEQLLTEHSNRYVATVTTASAGVGASAAIPAVGIPIALGLGVADMLFFYETSALYVLALAELHGVSVQDAERARPLVLGTLLGQKSQRTVSNLVITALGANAVNNARDAASGVVDTALPAGWGNLIIKQIPDSAIAPLTVVIWRESAKTAAKFGAGTFGKVLPFGVGAVVGGVGSFYFGSDVVKAARIAFPQTPAGFPEWLHDFAKSEREPAEPSRAAVAMQAAANNVTDFGEDVWGKVGAAADVFRSVDLDGDGIPDEARAITALKGTGAAIASAAGTLGSKATKLFTPKPKREG